MSTFPNSYSEPEILRFNQSKLTDQELIKLYHYMLKSRMIEEKMLTLLRQGKISKWFSGIGQEAIAVGVTLALKSEEYILPMHRNLGVFIGRDIELKKLFCQWQGKLDGFTKGRDRSFHFGSQEHRIIGMISHLGPQMGVACGLALANRLEINKEVVAVFTGEGGTSEGDFHEALNIASVWKLPVIFCIENNGYGLSTTTAEQYACEHLADRGQGYGIKSHIIEGNNVLEVYRSVKDIVIELRENPEPVLLEFKTFRMRGHEEASGTKYVPQYLLDFWQKKDPLLNYEFFLKESNILTNEEITFKKSEITKEIDSHWIQALEEKDPTPDKINELNDVYAIKENTEKEKMAQISGTKKEMRFVDAISNALECIMDIDPKVLLMGQDVAEYGGVFKVSEGFLEKFGKDRIRNTPICESGVIETAYGLSLKGFKPIVEMQFADFVSSGFNPIVNLLAKSHYRWGQPANVVIRMPCGGGVGAGPFHSQTNESWFLNTPGLKIVYPAFPADAKGLLIASVKDPNPVLFYEHKALYRSVREQIPEDSYEVPLGKASCLLEGNEVSVITYGYGVHWALDFLKEKEIDADLIDLRSLQPLDNEMIFNSVKKTGKVLLLQEDSKFCGLASELSALITENCFEYLDAPIMRVASLDTPIPFNPILEKEYLPNSRFEKSLSILLEY